MKHAFLLSALLCLLITQATAQENTNKPKTDTSAKTPAKEPLKPYEQDPTLPDFKIILMDSSIMKTSEIPKGKPIMLLFFDPTCKHCKDFTKNMLAGMDSLKNTRIYMITNCHNMNDIRTFYKDFHLENYKNIKAIGRDPDFFYITHYGVRTFPDMTVYDKRKKLVKHFSGETTVAELYKCTH